MSNPRGRILFLVGGFQVGGTERHLSLVLPRLNRFSWEIHVRLTGEDGPLSAPLKEAGLDVATIEPKARLNLPKIRAAQAIWSQIAAAAREMRELRPDVVHCYLPEPSAIGWLASRVAARPRFLIMSKRSQFIRPGSFAGEKWLERRALKAANYVLGNSTAVVKELQQIGIPPERTHLIPNGIDLQPFREAPGRDDVRTREGWPQEAVIFVLLANLIPYKGHEGLFLALKGLAQNGPDWKVVLIGSGSPERELYLRRLVAHMELDDRVVFSGQRSDIPALLSGADVGVLTSRHEGFSNTLLEYMAAGLPVVATKVGGNTDAVMDGKTGILVPAASPGALSGALDRMRLDPSLRRNMGKEGRARASKYFSVSDCVKAYDEFYRSLLNPRV
jgi:glycosyltransferase involved in cell wall biosynthesis